jgi:hypothetical protein
MALTLLMVGRLDDGLRSEIKGEIKALSEDLAWHLKVGGRVARVAGGDEWQRSAGGGGRGWS